MKKYIIIFIFIPVVLYSQSAEELTLKATLLLVNEKSEEALEHVNMALRKDQNFAKAYMVRTSIHHFMGKYKLALEDINKYIGLVNNNPDAYFTRGNIYVIIGELDFAIRPKFEFS